MKKHIFSIAIVAAGLLVAACGNKSKDGNPQVTDDGFEGQAPVEAALPEVKTAIDGAAASLSLPDGWIEISSDRNIDVLKGQSIDEIGEAPSLHFEVKPVPEGKDLDGIVAMLTENPGFKADGEMALGERVIKNFKMEGDAAASLFIDGDKFVLAMMTGVKPTDADVKAILNSVKAK